jgi:hypothetical protein
VEASAVPLQNAGGAIDTVPPGATRTYDLRVGADERATLLVNSESSALDVAVSAAEVAPTSMFMLPATAAAFTGPQQLTVTNNGSTPASFFSFLLVASGRELTVDVPTLTRPGATAAVTAMLDGGLPGDAPEYSLTGPTGAVVSSGPMSDAGGGKWTADVVVPAVGDHSVTVWVEGEQPRAASAPLIAATGGSIEGGFVESVVDQDGDSLADWLQVDVPVDVAAAGDYRLAAQLLDGQGRVVAASGTTGSLAAGSGQLTLRFDGRSLHDAQIAGPWHLGEVTLSDAGLAPLDIEANLGTVTHHDPGSFEHDVIDVGSFSDRGVDSDGDGRFETLQVVANVGVEAAGGYAVNAKLAPVFQ